MKIPNNETPFQLLKREHLIEDGTMKLSDFKDENVVIRYFPSAGETLSSILIRKEDDKQAFYSRDLDPTADIESQITSLIEDLKEESPKSVKVLLDKSFKHADDDYKSQYFLTLVAPNFFGKNYSQEAIQQNIGISRKQKIREENGQKNIYTRALHQEVS